jgi:NAD(P)-dependent dehydrogenase (short-subunit alcohol dehydrogenase family)
VLARVDASTATTEGSTAGAAPTPDTDGGLAPGASIASTCVELGAQVFECPLPVDHALGLDEAALERDAHAVAGAALDALDDASAMLLAVDGASLFAHAGAEGGAEGPRRGLRVCLAVSWVLTRAVATSAFLPSGRGGRIVYLAPAADSGEYARPARAGLENLARTLSIEWARHAVTTAAIVPRDRVRGGGGGMDTAGEVAALTAYLASPAGAYFSGCLLDLSGPEGASPI